MSLHSFKLCTAKMVIASRFRRPVILAFSPLARSLGQGYGSLIRWRHFPANFHLWQH
jgi:hypothetical protein